METFVISFYENNIKEEVIWHGSSRGKALRTFWRSFDMRDAKKITDIKIFKLVEIVCDTSNLFEEN